MRDIIPFEFEDHTIRIIEIDGEPWFIAKDVARALGYTNIRGTIGRHCKRDKPMGGTETVPPYHLDPQTVIIPESDVYRLIMRSRLPSAERFEAKVVEEILPSIRKTGHYKVAEVAPMSHLAMDATIWLSAIREARLLKGKYAATTMWELSSLPPLADEPKPSNPHEQKITHLEQKFHELRIDPPCITLSFRQIVNTLLLQGVRNLDEQKLIALLRRFAYGNRRIKFDKSCVTLWQLAPGNFTNAYLRDSLRAHMSKNTARHKIEEMQA